MILPTPLVKTNLFFKPLNAPMKPAISAIFSFHSFFSNKFTWRRVWGFSAAGGGIEAVSQPVSQSVRTIHFQKHAKEKPNVKWRFDLLRITQEGELEIYTKTPSPLSFT
jgi:hypothetical protein